MKEDSPPGEHESRQYLLARLVPTLDGRGRFPTPDGSSEVQALSQPPVFSILILRPSLLRDIKIG